MKRPFVAILSATLLIISAHRLPAPITEQTPAPADAAAPVESGSTKKKSQHSGVSNALSRFEGTWRASGTHKTKFGNTIQVVQTLIIKNSSAEFILDETGTLAGGNKWHDVPAPYNSTSPLYSKRINRSTNIKTEGSNLRIFWQGAKLVSWSPNTVPASAFKDPQGKPTTVLLILSGDHLIDTNGKQSQTYARVQ